MALDKLSAGGGFGQTSPVTPKVPGLGDPVRVRLQRRAVLRVGHHAHADDPDQAPDPKREEKTGFDGWRQAGVDSMVIVPRASTHLEYTDINFALPASRYGQDVASHYTQAWLDKYLKHDPSADARLLATSFKYLEPVGQGRWAPVTLKRADRLSFYFCSGYAFRSASGRRLENTDIASVGGC